MKYKIKREIEEMAEKLYISACIHNNKRICAKCIEENLNWITKEAATQAADLVIKKSCRTYDYAADVIKEVFN